MTKPQNGSGDKKTGSHIFPEKPSGAPLLGKGLSRAAIIGLHPLGGMLVGGGIGYWLRLEYGFGWSFPALLLIGLAAGCLNAYRDARSLLREEESDHDTKKPSQH